MSCTCKNYEKNKNISLNYAHATNITLDGNHSFVMVHITIYKWKNKVNITVCKWKKKTFQYINEKKWKILT